jgi:hypothetical protein
MLKTVLNMLAGAFIVSCITAAFAVVVGTPPGNGFQLIDGQWLQQLAQGNNAAFVNGITAHAGGTQAACFVLPNNAWLYEIDTVASSNDSVCLPFASAGDQLTLRNAGANTAAVFALSTTNPGTSSTDTINGQTNSTTFTLTANWVMDCMVAKNGAWSCARGN